MIDKKIVTRPYNQIEIKGRSVIKTGPIDRINRETAWFREAKKHIPNNIPKIYSMNENSYEMEKINGDNLYQWISNQNNSSKVTNVMKNAFNLTLNELHKKKLAANKKDIELMYYLKPMMALERFLKDCSIDPTKLIINHEKMENPLVLFPNTYHTLEDQLSNTAYSFIHGDLTLSNILIDNKLKLYLIDPRGNFGDTEIYGDIRYDVAKMYYSIAGDFDCLNSGRFTHSLNEQNRRYSIESLNHHNLSNLLLSTFRENEELIKFIHTTIWISLISHIDNEQQRYATFCNGVSLINKLKHERSDK